MNLLLLFKKMEKLIIILKIMKVCEDIYFINFMI